MKVLLLATLLFVQTPNTAQRYFGQAQQLAQTNPQAAIPLYQQAEQAALAAQDSTLAIRATLMQAACHKYLAQFDASQADFVRADSSMQGKNLPLLRLELLNQWMELNFLQGQYQQALNQQREAVQLAEARDTVDQLLLRSYNNLGLLTKRLGYFEEARSSLEKNRLLLWEHLPQDTSSQIHNLHNLGLIYADLGQLKLSKDLIQQGLQLHRAFSGYTPYKEAVSVWNLAEVSLAYREHAQALAQLAVARQTALAYLGNPSHPMLIEMDLFGLDVELNLLEAADATPQDSSDNRIVTRLAGLARRIEASPAATGSMQVFYHQLQARLLSLQGQPEAALTQWAAAEEVREREEVILYLAGNALHKAKNLLALNRQREAIALLKTLRKPSEYDDGNAPWLAPQHAIEARQLQARAAYQLYTQSQSVSWLDSASLWINQCQLLTLQHLPLDLDPADRQLSNRLEELQLLALHIRLSRSDQLAALYHSNKAKANRLWLQSQLALQTAESPSPQTERINQHRAQLRALQGLLRKQPDYRLQKIYREQVLQLRVALAEAMNDWQQEEFQDMSAVREAFAERLREQSQLIINYHLLDTELVILTSQGGEVSMYTKTLPSDFNQQLAAFQKLVSDPASDQQALQTSGQGLYTLLLEPLSDQLQAGAGLLIIPHQALANLPFDYLLLTHGPHEDLVVSTRFALDLPGPGSSNTEAALPFLGIASQYTPGGNNPGLPALQHNQQEVQAISQQMGGTNWLVNEATPARFLQEASRYRVIHIANHTLVDPAEPLRSAITFPISADSTGRLELSQLYQMQLRAGLVTLSSCNSGIGQYQGGEGSLSLAYGFRYAGAGGVLMSLWPVDDASTSTLMRYFYETLQTGSTAAEALQQAKKRYKQTAAPAYQHPYYWAGFMLIGQDQGNESSILVNTYGLLLVAFFLLLASYFGFRRKARMRKSKSN